jgi:hypothetical protein
VQDEDFLMSFLGNSALDILDGDAEQSSLGTSSLRSLPAVPGLPVGNPLPGQPVLGSSFNPSLRGLWGASSSQGQTDGSAATESKSQPGRSARNFLQSLFSGMSSVKGRVLALQHSFPVSVLE